MAAPNARTAMKAFIVATILRSGCIDYLKSWSEGLTMREEDDEGGEGTIARIAKKLAFYMFLIQFPFLGD